MNPDMTTSTIALFVTFLVDQFFPRIGEASVRLLEAAGCRVEVPEGQTCCGQPMWNAGHAGSARRLVRRTVEIFEPFETIVAPSGSCASVLRVHAPEILADDPAWHERASRLAGRVQELTEYLAGRGFEASASRFRGRVAYHASCHLLRDLGVVDAPRTLLETVPGVELVELADAEVCCGFGGLFSTKMPELSTALLDDKLGAAEDSGADVLTATDCGCLMHLGGALSRRGSALCTLHVAEILAFEDQTED